MTKYEKVESCLIIIFEVTLCTLKNWKKFRGILKKKVTGIKKKEEII